MLILAGLSLSKPNLNLFAPDNPGIYLLIATGGTTDPLVAYIGGSGYGKTRTIKRRLRDHLKELDRAVNNPSQKNSANKRLKNHVLKYGVSTLFWYVLETLDHAPGAEELALRETAWIQLFSVMPLANAGRTADPVAGVKHGPEFGQVVRLRNMGIKHSKEWNSAISEGNKGKKMPEASIRRGKDSPSFGKPTSEKQKESARRLWQSKTDEEQKAWSLLLSSKKTQEQHILSAKNSNAAQTPGQRSARQKKAWATRVARGKATPEILSARARKAADRQSPEKHHQNAMKAAASQSPEKHHQNALKAAASKRQRMVQQQSLVL